MVSGNHKLTAQQEHFAQLLFQGKDQAEAKRLAYPKCNLTGNALYVNASRLANLAKIRLRVNELRNAVVSPLIADEIERQEFWSQTMRSKDEETKDRLRASELLGKKQQDFAERTENKGRQEIIVRVVYEDRPRIVDGTVIEKRKSLKDGSG